MDGISGAAGWLGKKVGDKATEIVLDRIRGISLEVDKCDVWIEGSHASECLIVVTPIPEDACCVSIEGTLLSKRNAVVGLSAFHIVAKRGDTEWLRSEVYSAEFGESGKYKSAKYVNLEQGRICGYDIMGYFGPENRSTFLDCDTLLLSAVVGSGKRKEWVIARKHDSGWAT